MSDHIPQNDSLDRDFAGAAWSEARPTARIPLWFKLAYTAFCCVLVPKYWIDYGPTNFLYFCDVALLMTLVALWREDKLLASMPAVGILLPQALWMADFLGTAVGLPLLGMTGYMFNPKIPLFTRGLSFFHFWLPIVLVWMVWRLGYDRRAIWGWTGIAMVLLVVCYFLMPAPPAPTDNPNLPVNINYVHGLSDTGPLEFLPPTAYFALLLVTLPACIYAPTHWALNRWFGVRSAS